MNIDKLKQRGFTIDADPIKYAAKVVSVKEDEFDTNSKLSLIISVEESGCIYIEEELQNKDFTASLGLTKLGEVNSVEQFLVVYDAINAINATGGHTL